MAYTRIRRWPTTWDIKSAQRRRAMEDSRRKKEASHVALRRKWHPYYIDLTQGKVCTYCGRPYTTKDHVPAPIWLERLGIEWFEARGIGLFLIDACLRCNSTLGGYPLFTTRERRSFMQSPTYRRSILEDLKRPWRDYIADLD